MACFYEAHHSSPMSEMHPELPFIATIIPAAGFCDFNTRLSVNASSAAPCIQTSSLGHICPFTMHINAPYLVSGLFIGAPQRWDPLPIFALDTRTPFPLLHGARFYAQTLLLRTNPIAIKRTFSRLNIGSNDLRCLPICD